MPVLTRSVITPADIDPSQEPTHDVVDQQEPENQDEEAQEDDSPIISELCHNVQHVMAKLEQNDRQFQQVLATLDALRLGLRQTHGTDDKPQSTDIGIQGVRFSSSTPARPQTCTSTGLESNQPSSTPNRTHSEQHGLDNNFASSTLVRPHSEPTGLGNQESSDVRTRQTRNMVYDDTSSSTNNINDPPRDHRRNDVASTPLVINQVTPPTFAGEGADARAWLRDYDSIMGINGYDDNAKLVRMQAYLTGIAKKWYLVTQHFDRDMDWITLKKAFLTHFCGADGLAELSRRLDAISQRPDEHPSNYLMRALNLCIQVDSSMTSSEMVNKVVRGLSVNIKNQLALARRRQDWTIQYLKEAFIEYQSPTPATKAKREDKKSSRATSHLNPPRKIRDLSAWICVNCDQKGHTIQTCPQPKDENKIKAGLEALRASARARRESSKTNATENTPRAVYNLQTSPPLSRARKPQLPGDDLPKPRLELKVNGHAVVGRVDTGTDISTVPLETSQRLGLQLLPWNLPPLLAVGGTKVIPYAKTPVLVEYGDLQRPILMAVIKHSNEPLWGNDLLQSLDVELRMGQITNQPITPDSVESPKPSSFYVSSLTTDVGTQNTNETTQVTHPLQHIKLNHVSDAERRSFETLLTEYGDTFSKDELDIGRTRTIKHAIHLNDQTPIHKPPYRIPYRHRSSMQETISRMLATGAIRESTSPYASPVFFVDKDHGQDKRLVADFRALNAKTVLDRTPMPHPEDVFGMLAGSKIFAKLDITSMFNQIEIEEEDIQKTAIITPFGLFECPLMPFGLANAPATAVKLMRKVLSGIDSKICYVYFDDIIVFAPDVGSLTERCREVLERLRQHNLKLKPSKCYFGVESISFLGHMISPRGIEVDPSRISKVNDFKTPRNTSDVRSFYGLCSYNRKFIKDFAAIARPLTPLMGKPSEFNWTPEADEAFKRLKASLTTTPVLVHFDPDAEHELRTDASSYAIGAILFQVHQKKELTGVVLYYSKTLTATQRNYSATERELLAAFSAIMDLKHYLIGKKFTLVTDHAALSTLRSHKDPHHRLARWIAQLQAFDFDVVYKSGSKHLDADAMSRLPNSSTPECNVAPGIIEAVSRVINSLQTSVEEPSIQQDTQDPVPNQSEQPEGSQNPQLQDIEPERPDLRLEQLEDPYCRKYIDILESQDLSERDKASRARNFTMQDGQLYHIQREDTFLMVIPERRRSAILTACHDVPLSGHLGFSRTYALIKCRYYWPHLRKDVKRYVASCIHCQRRKASNTRRRGLTHPLPIAEEVFDTLGIDLMVKLPKTHSNYIAILVITDNLSKYVVTVPLRDERTDTIMFAFFDQFIAKYGCPRLVISDRGTNLCGERASMFFNAYGIKRRLTSAYRPQSNGQTERFNRTFAASLTAYVNANHNNWSDYVQAVTFAYNVSEHTVTKVPPYEAVFGRKPRLFIDNLMNRSEFINPLRPSQDIRSATAIALIKKLILKNQNINKKRLDKNLKAMTFDVGDLVLFEKPVRISVPRGGANKLTYLYIGPYRIKRKCSDLTYELEPTTNKTRTQIAHAHLLKRFIPREDFAQDDLVNPKFFPSEKIAEMEQADDNDSSTDQASEVDDVADFDYRTDQLLNTDQPPDLQTDSPIDPPAEMQDNQSVDFHTGDLNNNDSQLFESAEDLEIIPSPAFSPILPARSPSQPLRSDEITDPSPQELSPNPVEVVIDSDSQTGNEPSSPQQIDRLTMNTDNLDISELLENPPILNLPILKHLTQ